VTELTFANGATHSSSGEKDDVAVAVVTLGARVVAEVATTAVAKTTVVVNPIAIIFNDAHCTLHSSALRTAHQSRVHSVWRVWTSEVIGPVAVRCTCIFLAAVTTKLKRRDQSLQHFEVGTSPRFEMAVSRACAGACRWTRLLAPLSATQRQTAAWVPTCHSRRRMSGSSARDSGDAASAAVAKAIRSQVVSEAPRLRTEDVATMA
jgi:hypothetical protein